MDDELIISPVKLTIGILVSNRIQYIRKVMEGIKPLLQKIPSELIVVDTKGADGDGSIEIVKEYTDKIYPFVWCNDFSKARNVVFEHAQGEWFLHLDDDECLDGVPELIDFFKSGQCNQYQSGSLVLRNYDAEGNFTIGKVVRLFRRRKSTHYEGAVHEQICDVGQPVKEFSSVIHHYGYAFTSLEEAQKHQKRNVDILKQELETSGYTPHLCAQMTQELIYLESSADEGMQFAQNALNILQATNQLKNPMAQYMMYATVLYFLRKQDTQKAIGQITLIQETYPLLEITKLTLYGIRAELALEQKDIGEMLKQALNYVSLWDWKEAHMAEASGQMVFRFPQYCTTAYYYRILHIGGAAGNELECYMTAKEFWNRIPWKAEGFDAAPYQQDLSNTLQGLKRIQALQKQYPELCEQLEVLEAAAKEARALEEAGQTEYTEEYQAVMNQLLEAVYNRLRLLLHEKSKCLALLKHVFQEKAPYEIGQIKESIQEECMDVLSKNGSNYL